MTTESQTYATELLHALRLRDVPGPRIADVLAEVSSHLTETGEDPREAFGPPTVYAEEITAALGHPGEQSHGWRASWDWTSLTYGLGGMLGAWLLIDGAIGLRTDGDGPLGLPAALASLLGLAVVVSTVVGLRRLARSSEDRVLDPRTGEDMTPPLPGWVVPAMVCPPVVAIGIAVLVGVTSH